MDLLSESRNFRPLPLRVVRRLRTITDETSDFAEQGRTANCHTGPKMGRRALKTLAPLMPEKSDDMESPIVSCDDLPDAAAASPAELCERSEHAQSIAGLVGRALSHLSIRQREVVLATFPSDGSKTKSKSQIAAELGISYQRVQRILDASLRRMRSEITMQKCTQEDCILST